MGSYSIDDTRCLSTSPGSPVTKVVSIVVHFIYFTAYQFVRVLGAQWLASAFVGRLVSASWLHARLSGTCLARMPSRFRLGP